MSSSTPHLGWLALSMLLWFFGFVALILGTEQASGRNEVGGKEQSIREPWVGAV